MITEKYMSKIFSLSSLCFLCIHLLVVCILLQLLSLQIPVTSKHLSQEKKTSKIQENSYIKIIKIEKNAYEQEKEAKKQTPFNEVVSEEISLKTEIT